MNISPEFAAALIAASAEIEGAIKNAINPHFKRPYADMASVVQAIKPALVKHGICLMQPIEAASDRCIVKAMLVYKSGEILHCGSISLPSDKNTPQGYGSAITYGRRYLASSLMFLSTHDDDGNEAEKEAQNGKNAKQPKATARQSETPVNIPAPGEPWIYYIAKLTPDIEKLLAIAKASYDDSIGCFLCEASLGKEWERVRVKTREQMDKLQLARKAKKLESKHLVVESVEVQK